MMAVSLRRRRRRLRAIGFGALVIALLPNTIGFQDLGALLARQPAVAERVREHLIASPFGTIHAAMFSLPRPVGTAMPPPPVYALVNFDPTDVTGSIGSQPLGDSVALQFPKVNRKTKGDSLISRARAPLPPLLTIEPAPESDAALRKDEPRFNPYSQYEFASVPDEQAADTPSAISRAVARNGGGGKDVDRVYFGADSMAAEQGTIAPWAPGEAPVAMASRVYGDSDIKESALGPPQQTDKGKHGESIASKGEVTGVDRHPRSPAERLGLAGAARTKAEKCLSNAVYFEARDEPVRAQIAVAQVVMNRVFSPFYPNDVCSVVYQNSWRHNACQFTFACDGTRIVISEPDAWARAQRIARDVLDGKLWMPEVAKSTHYHDDWAHPNWVGEMRKMDKLGGLIFYRPRAWGDGSGEPTWGNAKATAEEVKKL